MDTSKKRPRPGSKSPNIKQSKEVLQHLLEVELVRLETAVRIEKERSIVFPETSVIIRDIQKIQAALTGKNDNVDLFES